MDIAKKTNWHEVARAIRPETRLPIDGKSRHTPRGETLSAINPASGAVVAEIACGGDTDIERAASVAARRFREGEWSRMLLRQRVDVLSRFAA